MCHLWSSVASSSCALFLFFIPPVDDYLRSLPVPLSLCLLIDIFLYLSHLPLSLYLSPSLSPSISLSLFLSLLFHLSLSFALPHSLSIIMSFFFQLSWRHGISWHCRYYRTNQTLSPWGFLSWYHLCSMQSRIFERL